MGKKSKNKKEPKITPFYADLQVIDELKVDPIVYGKLHRWDREALRDYVSLKMYHQEKSLEEMKHEKPDDAEEQPKAPAQVIRPRGR